MWFNNCVLDKSDQTANLIIAKVDPVPSYVYCTAEDFRQEKIFACVKIAEWVWVTFTVLVKILSLENYYNTEIARLGKNFIP